LEIQIHVIGYEQVQLAVLVVIQKRTACAPPHRFVQQPRLLSNVTKSAIPIVSIENILTVIGDKQIVVSVVIIVSHAGPLPPARAKQLGVSSHIRKGSILVIVVEVTDGFLPLRKTFQRCSVDKKDIW